MIMVEICKTYKWDYYMYLAQPVWFVDLIVEKMKIDAQKLEAEEKKAKQKR